MVSYPRQSNLEISLALIANSILGVTRIPSGHPGNRIVGHEAKSVFIGEVQAEGQDKAEEEGSAESCSGRDCPTVTEAAPRWNSGSLCLHQCLPI